MEPAGGVLRHGGDQTVGGGERTLRKKKVVFQKNAILHQWDYLLALFEDRILSLSCTAAPLKGL